MHLAAQIVPWVIAVVMLGWAIYLKGHSNRVRVTDRHDHLIAVQNERLRQLELEMARQQSPLMKQVQDLLSAGLHHPDPQHARQDYLLERLDQALLTIVELPELEAILNERIANPASPPGEVEAALALKAIMPIVVKERAAITSLASSEQLGLAVEKAT